MNSTVLLALSKTGDQAEIQRIKDAHAALQHQLSTQSSSQAVLEALVICAESAIKVCRSACHSVLHDPTQHVHHCKASTSLVFVLPVCSCIALSPITWMLQRRAWRLTSLRRAGGSRPVSVCGSLLLDFQCKLIRVCDHIDCDGKPLHWDDQAPSRSNATMVYASLSTLISTNQHVTCFVEMFHLRPSTSRRVLGTARRELILASNIYRTREHHECSDYDAFASVHLLPDGSVKDCISQFLAELSSKCSPVSDISSSQTLMASQPGSYLIASKAHTCHVSAWS